MTHTPFMLEKSTNNFCDIHKQDKLFTIPFSECDVLQLQQLFVACGIHTIKVSNVSQGRFIIQTILNSLNYYHNIGCMTNNKGLAIGVHDIIQDIENHKNIENNHLSDLESFFSVHASFDFIWIEFTESMKKIYSLKDIEKIFTMYYAQERMPVLIVMYDQE